MNGKIDKTLLRQVSILSEEKFVLCYVFSKNRLLMRKFLRSRKVGIESEYSFINAFLCKLKRNQIFELSRVDFVVGISACTTASTLMYVAKKILSCENLGLYGTGVGVAFIDTGISPHCDFLIGASRVKIFRDFIAGKTEMYDDNGHGTFVCGVCSGAGILSAFRYAGIAPKSQIFALKALNQNGEAGANKILDAMEWIYDNHRKFSIKVACMSFGSEPLGSNDPIMLGAEALWNDGVVVVAAAGNSGPEYQTIKSPGISRKIITVGGMDDNRTSIFHGGKEFSIADFSSRGPAMRSVKPDLVAPSVDIVSCATGEPYTTLSGTSVATPMVAGLACLLLEKYPQITPNQTKNLLLHSCDSLGYEMNWEGYGLPNFSKIKLED